MEDIFKIFWSTLAGLVNYLGIFIIPATLYGLLECIKYSTQGKNTKEHKKVFVWTAVGLIFLFAPVLSGLYR